MPERRVYLNLRNVLRRHAPGIMTLTAIAGVGATVYFSVRAGAVSSEKIRQNKPETKADIVKLVWRDYIPVAGAAAGTVFVIVGAWKSGAAKYSNMYAAFSFLQQNGAEFRKAVLDEVGEEKFKDICETAVSDKLRRVKPPAYNKERKGYEWFYEPWTDELFYDTREHVMECAYKLNREFIQTGGVTLNSWLELLGIEPKAYGDTVGWFNGNDFWDYNWGYFGIIGWIGVEFRKDHLDDGREVSVIVYTPLDADFEYGDDDPYPEVPECL